MIPRERTLIVTYAGGLKRRPGLFARTGLGMEVSDYAFGRTLDDPGFPALHEEIRGLVREVTGLLAVHGPYRSMDPASPDPRIRAVCADRYARAFACAADIGASHLVLHSGYDPHLRSESYDRVFVERSADLLGSLLAAHPRITLALENMFDPDPAPLSALVDALAGRACALLDTGHLNVFSALPPADWARELGGRVGYLHLNDNAGDLDRHLPVGAGSFDFKSFFAAVEGSPILAVEVKDFAEVRASFAALAALGVVDPALAEVA